MNDRIGVGARPAEIDPPPRERIEAAIIELVGSHGYEATTVAAVCAIAGTDRAAFDGCFEGKEDCFLRVHGAATDELCLLVNAAYASPASWQNRIWAAGWAAIRFLNADPLRAHFLLVGVNGAGSRAQGRRDRVIQGLADLIDGGRGELADPASVTRNTAEMIAGAIYCTVLGKLQAGWAERGEHFLPQLIYMATMPYLGSRAAEDALSVQPLG